MVLLVNVCFVGGTWLDSTTQKGISVPLFTCIIFSRTRFLEEKSALFPGSGCFWGAGRAAEGRGRVHCHSPVALSRLAYPGEPVWAGVRGETKNVVGNEKDSHIN